MSFDREQWERKLARLAEVVERRTLARIVAALGDPPAFSNIPASLWSEIEEQYRNAIDQVFRDMYRAQAQSVAGSAAGTVDFTLTNEQAARWARGYSFDLVKGMTDNLRAGLQSAISSFFTEQGTTTGDLTARLQTLWGSKSRAEMIAITEVTRASEQAKPDVEREIKSRNPAIDFDVFWETDKDEYVCPICRPLQGTKAAPGGQFVHPITGATYEPPAHPRCRCRTRRVMVVRGKKAVEVG